MFTSQSRKNTQKKERNATEKIKQNTFEKQTVIGRGIKSYRRQCERACLYNINYGKITQNKCVLLAY